MGLCLVAAVIAFIRLAGFYSKKQLEKQVIFYGVLLSIFLQTFIFLKYAILYPYANEGEIEFMLATAQKSYDAFKDGVKDGGIIVIEPNLVKPSEEDKKRWKIYEIPIISIAKDEIGRASCRERVSSPV